MSAIDKALRAAVRLTQGGEAVKATQVIRNALAGIVGAPAPGQPPDEAGEPAPATPFSCFGAPSSFDFSKGVAGLAPRFGLGRPQTRRRAERAAPDPSARSEGMLARTYAGSCGSRAYKLFRPDGTVPPRALLVMLHGCSQNAEDFAAGTRMNVIARQNNVLVIYPEQSRSANASGCWNWFDPKDQKRDRGEPGIIAGLAREVAAEFGVEPGRIFVAGLSAGGAMAAILAETYPDVFAAVGIHSGLPYGAANDIPSAFSAMNGSAAGTWAFARPPGGEAPVRSAESELAALGVPAIVFHGDADHTVSPGNADAIVARFRAREAGLRPETQEGTAPGGRAYLKITGRDAGGVERFEHWTLIGGGHAWSGGSREGSYTDPNGPDASAEMMRFFLQTTPPEAAAE